MEKKMKKRQKNNAKLLIIPRNHVLLVLAKRGGSGSGSHSISGKAKRTKDKVLLKKGFIDKDS
jgi:hypothetical protein